MKAKEINFNGCETVYSLASYPSGCHYKFAMGLGRVWPTTKSQAKYFIGIGMPLGVLSKGDVMRIEDLCSRHGLDGTTNC